MNNGVGGMLEQYAHPNTRIMLEAWRRMDEMPLLDAAESSEAFAASALFGHMFVLRQVDARRWVFRTAGETLLSFFGKQVCDENFMDLWLGPDRQLVRGVMDGVQAEGAPGLLRARAETLTGHVIQVEIALAPLPGALHAPARILGYYQPLDSDSNKPARPIWRHIITEVRAPQPSRARPHLRLVSSRD